MIVDLINDNWVWTWFKIEHGDRYVKFLEEVTNKNPLNITGLDTRLLLVDYLRTQCNINAFAAGDLKHPYLNLDEKQVIFLRLKYE